LTGANAGYRAAREAAAWIDRSQRARIEFTGDKAADTLNGLLTNDILALKPGAGCYAAALTAKGKIIADVRVFARDGSYLVDTSAAAGPGLLAMLKKYVNPRLATYRDVTAETGSIGVFGPHSASVVARSAGVAEADLVALGAFSHLKTALDDAVIDIARIPDLGGMGFELFSSQSAVATIAGRLGNAGAVPLSPDDADTMRVEAGRPLFGADMDENVLAQEAALDTLGAISFNKGCYTGQETVARVHFRGHVNRTLRGLRSGTPIDSGAELVVDGKPVGTVRSAAHSPTFGEIALAYVRREIETGASVTIRSATGQGKATVAALPFA